MPERTLYPGHIEVVVPSYLIRTEPCPQAVYLARLPPARPHPPSVLRNPLPPRTTPTAIPHSSLPSSASSSPSSSAATSPSRRTRRHLPPRAIHHTPQLIHPPHHLRTILTNRCQHAAHGDRHSNSWRLSQETVLDDPEIYLVADGFRPEDPPEYSSRPPSLYNGQAGP